MRHDGDGLFWQDIDYKTQKKHDLLSDQGWEQVYPGFWAESWKLEVGEEPDSIITFIEAAYMLARESKYNTKREPPKPIWLDPSYLPGLDEAREFNVPLFTDAELSEASYEWIRTGENHKLIYDIESYGNYFLIAFYSLCLKKVTYLELSDSSLLNTQKLKWIMSNFCTIGFNSNHYDATIAAMAIHGCSTAAMKTATSMIIEQNMRPYEVLRHFKVKRLKGDTIDLKEVAPLFASLKIYGGRMHTKRMQDLPFPPSSVLLPSQIDITRYYCINDLRTTAELYTRVKSDLDLRGEMGTKYGMDLRSKSDAQIAEAVIGSELEKLNGCRSYQPKIDPGTAFYYRTPDYMNFRTPLLNHTLSSVVKSSFVVGDSGSIGLPQQLKDLRIVINNTTYKLGIGGLHSCEKGMRHFADDNTILVDRDVTSYYPIIILNQGLYPYHLTENFLTVYRDIVTRRITAKLEGNKKVAGRLKIVINGSFGKFASKYSLLYSPQLLIQVTLTGQLSLLMLIERLELADIPVVSANTDGLVIKCPKALEGTMNSIVQRWEQDTNFDTEATEYAALFSRDVNNYIAITHPKTWKESAESRDKVKTKGIFAKPGLSKNPQNEICVDAVIEKLLNGTPVEETIRGGKDIKKYLNVRTVKGGAVKITKDGESEAYLGKAIRWYYNKDETGEIVYSISGNRVPNSEGATPLMDLPSELPNNIDYLYYEKETHKMLSKINFY